MMLIVGNWWSFVLRGLVAILFAIMAFFIPGMALLTLVYIFGFYAIADGAFNIMGAMHRSAPDQTPWWALLIEGIFGIIAGCLAFFLPGITAVVLLYVIAGWAIATGIMELVASVRLRTQMRGEWVLAIAGLLSVLFGLMLLFFPGAGILAVLLWTGAYAAVFGVLLISLGIRLRAVTRQGDHLGHFHGAVPGH
jgi:uncharacterized membrane protein HdeD (DUF308 family)